MHGKTHWATGASMPVRCMCCPRSRLTPMPGSDQAVESDQNEIWQQRMVLIEKAAAQHRRCWRECLPARDLPAHPGRKCPFPACGQDASSGLTALALPRWMESFTTTSQPRYSMARWRGRASQERWPGSGYFRHERPHRRSSKTGGAVARARRRWPACCRRACASRPGSERADSLGQATAGATGAARVHCRRESVPRQQGARGRSPPCERVGAANRPPSAGPVRPPPVSSRVGPAAPPACVRPSDRPWQRPMCSRGCVHTRRCASLHSNRSFARQTPACTSYHLLCFVFDD